MVKDGRYQFPQEDRKTLESVPLAIAIYQYVNQKVVTLLVTDQLCEMIGKSRSLLVNHFDDNMFGNVHPEDVGMLARLGRRFSTQEGPYDIVYRTKLYGREEYRYVHTIGRYQTMPDGSRVAFLSYTDITASELSLTDAAKEFNSPMVKFMFENTTALAIVSRKDSKLLYFNRAMIRMLQPKVTYDSGMTFQQYFYSDVPMGVEGLFELVDVGLRVMVEPRTRRKLEVNVVSSVWDEEPAYVLYIYEYAPHLQDADGETMLRYHRMAFNSSIMTGVGNDVPYGEDGYKGIHVWNLTQNKCVCCDGWSNLPKYSDERDISLDAFCSFFADRAVTEEDRAFILSCKREAMIKRYHAGTYPRNRILPFQTDKGRVYISFELAMMNSPDSGDLFLKISEENITGKAIVSSLLKKTVEQKCDYIAYVDVPADMGRIIYGIIPGGVREDVTVRISERMKNSDDLRKLGHIFHHDFENMDDFVDYIVYCCKECRTFTTVYDLPGDVYKSVTVELIDGAHKIFHIRCTDVSDLLHTEKERQRALAQAKDEALMANQGLLKAVQAERDKVERLSFQAILSISNALDARDNDTCLHSRRVAEYASEIARRLGWSDDRIQNLSNIALVHDIGKIGIPDAILLKEGKLTQEEFTQIKQHVSIGSSILKDFTAISKVAEAAMYHHERYDGHGYVCGLQGEEIPIEARIVGIADAVDAMNSTRPYRRRQSLAFIVAELKKERGMQFDPMLVDIMLKLIDEGILEDSKP